MTTAFPQSITRLLDVRLPDRLAAPLVFDSPHSGTLYPPDFTPCQPERRFRRAEDMYVDDLFAQVPQLGFPLLACLFPRIYCDVNRAADDIAPEALADGEAMTLVPTAKALLGKGTVWTRTPPDGAPLYDRQLTAREVRRRIKRCWRPYHDALAVLLDAASAEAQCVYHVNLHSMQTRANPMHEDKLGSRRPDMVVSDRKGTTCRPEFTQAAREILQDLGFEVKVNDPFKGAEIVRVSGRPEDGRHSLQLEINRGLYMNEETYERLPQYEETKAKLTEFASLLGNWVASQG
ncbi:N-formylglutamate amidohydrolase [Stappia sp. GBMRC 2046]|uniref:N-formylglutamate amidohydrolase n=1 Tax=Stappia sediminis TaxID=2692190 RepID=A0A7X3S7E4_9HYPH|nr:N-formylglutamate amidohydrolase [Stappia sediminis]MXN64708.1 N-formylglutamate amidohydrolase [Stappia sediminis]